jgi:excinuclease ABC subunit B
MTMLSLLLSRSSTSAWSLTSSAVVRSKLSMNLRYPRSRRFGFSTLGLPENTQRLTSVPLSNRQGFSSVAAATSVVSDEDVDVDVDAHPPSPTYDSTTKFEVTAKFDPMGEFILAFFPLLHVGQVSHIVHHFFTGDQPEAIKQLMKQLAEGDRFSILRGITGTGKTLVMSHVIANHGTPTLVLCHNKTLAAQLTRELRAFLGKSAVELFVSYYNHYVPESFVETTGKYTAKKSSVNADIDVLRHRATRALLTRRDVVVVASVSCIYGLGLPKEYLDASMECQVSGKGDGDGDNSNLVSWNDFLDKMASMLYTENYNDDEFERGHFQWADTGDDGKGKTVTVWPPHEKFPMVIDLQQVEEQESSGNDDDNGDKLMQVTAIREGSQQGQSSLSYTRIFPAKHHVISEGRLEEACIKIEDEMRDRVKELLHEGKRPEADRLQQRVINDLMMLRETGFCSGGENYSRHFAGRDAGEPPDTLMDYLGLHGDWLLVVDESHVALPQLKAMYGGDQARKRLLVKHGYRLPSALDNRPLQESEFWDQITKAVFVSATPAKQELSLAEREPVEMMIRPTFVCDPTIQVRPSEGQLGDLLKEVKWRAEKKQRTLAIALTKRDAEDLASFMTEQGVASTYIHSGLSTHERSDALRKLQLGDIDCLVGVNLLREGLDLPQVSLVAILNADSEGFLRSETALLQIVGRAARHMEGQAIFYANRVTGSMQRCMDDTQRRREKQLEYNEENGCEMKSTTGSSMQSIFDLLKAQIESEQPLEVIGRKKKTSAGTSQVSSIAIPPAMEALTPAQLQEAKILTDHIPTSPGVYFWKDADGSILYIGKAIKLRSRVKSYLSPNAKHSSRIKAMLKKAAFVDFVLTPSDRDALVLESNLIKHHQPPFNVLLKDDGHYPYICASVGDSFPRFTVVPYRQEGQTSTQQYRYFGPYTSFKEINAVLEGIEEKYDLRSQSFLARQGGGSKEEYQQLFEKSLEEVFTNAAGRTEGSLSAMRVEYEQAGMLFDSKYNQCRDVVAIGQVDNDASTAVVLVVQLRNGLVAGRFSYECKLPAGLTQEEDFSDVIQTVLERQHYPSGEESPGTRFSYFPDEVLLSHPPLDAKELKATIRQARSGVEPDRKSPITITCAATKGARLLVDARALEFASENARQVAFEKSLAGIQGSTLSSVDGTAAIELAALLSLDHAPTRIECYDISHTQGDFAVGSRVVFVGGKPAPHLYRRFNIQTVEGVDDYASLEEVLERRFRRAWINGEGGPVDIDDPWALPDLVVIDGGPGQLGAAIKGMGKANIFPMSSKSTSSGTSSNDIVEEDAEQQYGDPGRRACVAVCALAKNQEEVFVYDQKKAVNDAPDSPALLLLRSLRDESHRFALNAHRKRRSVRKSS